jgi:hypothetical protein
MVGKVVMSLTLHLRWAVPTVYTAVLVWIIVANPMPEPALSIVQSTMFWLALVVGIPYGIVSGRRSRDEVAKEAVKFASILALPATVLASFFVMLFIRYWEPAGQALLNLAATSQSGTTPLTTLGFVFGYIVFTVTATVVWLALYLGWWIAKR